MEAIKFDESSQENFKINPLPIPPPVRRAIEKLGADIALARRRRRISQASLAERMGASVSTVKRLENGDLRVPFTSLPGRSTSSAKLNDSRTFWIRRRMPLASRSWMTNSRSVSAPASQRLTRGRCKVGTLKRAATPNSGLGYPSR